MSGSGFKTCPRCGQAGALRAMPDQDAFRCYACDKVTTGLELLATTNCPACRAAGPLEPMGDGGWRCSKCRSEINGHCVYISSVIDQEALDASKWTPDAVLKAETNNVARDWNEFERLHGIKARLVEIRKETSHGD